MSNSKFRELLAARVPMVHITLEGEADHKELMESVCDGLDLSFTKTDLSSLSLNKNGVPHDVGYVRDINAKQIYIGSPMSPSHVWDTMMKKQRTLVLINLPSHPMVDPEWSQFYVDAGRVVPDDAYIEGVIDVIPEEDRPKAVSLLRGMSTSSILEALLCCRGDFSPAKLRASRNLILKTPPAVDQLDTKMDLYIPDPRVTELIDEIRLFLDGPQSQLMIPKGTIFDGMPGTGKTEAAKAIANELNLSLYKMDVGNTYNKYVGESEARFKAGLEFLSENAPCVALIDEVEKLFNSSYGGSSHGTTGRMLSTLLWWLQDSTPGLYVVMTTNHSTSIPPELIRPGRIDQKITLEPFQYNDAASFTHQLAQGLFGEIPEFTVAGILESVDQPFTASRLKEGIVSHMRKMIKKHGLQYDAESNSYINGDKS